ncbi:MAG: adenylate/guanylate cyclase domain-containing protein [Archangium sp.]|nr:adenylate/guanylate cyclase domain-containing protein [Archangium sp.]MDP3569142.1 adenylate/guanylate cyclase domain-containing protein [Archangium sp.]
MRAFLNRVINAGVDGQSPQDTKHIRLTNQVSLVVMGLAFLAFADPRVLGNRALEAISLGAILVYAAVPFFASRGWHLLARLWLCLGSVVWIGADGLLMGADTEQHLFLIAVGTAGWFLTPRRERWIAAVVAVLCGAIMLGIDLFAPARALLRAGALPFNTADKLSLYVVLQALAYYSVMQTERAEDELTAEQGRSEALLLNVLPRRIAEQLKRKEGSIAERFDSTTVMFADLVNFTQLSERTPATELVQMLDQIFSGFDALADKYGLEKIKTIGDAYMVVGGVPEARVDHAEAVAAMSLDMVQMLKELIGPEFEKLNLRIGIHSGPVVAGVIGKRKFVFDLWGDTVNTASRMESHGQPGRVHVSQATYELLAGQFTFEPRGLTAIKGKGEMNTYFLVSPSPEVRGS